MTQRMGFHPPVTDDSVNDWDEWCCCCHHNPPVPIWPTQYTEDMGCNLWPLHQWGDATSPISVEELVLWLYLRSMKFDFSSCAHCSKLWSCLAQFETHVHSMMHLSGGQASWVMSCACIRMWNQLESSSVVGSSNTCFCWITRLFWNSHSEKKKCWKFEIFLFPSNFVIWIFWGKFHHFWKNITSVEAAKVVECTS